MMKIVALDGLKTLFIVARTANIASYGLVTLCTDQCIVNLSILLSSINAGPIRLIESLFCLFLLSGDMFS